MSPYINDTATCSACEKSLCVANKCTLILNSRVYCKSTQRINNGKIGKYLLTSDVVLKNMFKLNDRKYEDLSRSSKRISNIH